MRRSSMCPFCWTQTAAGCLLQCPLLWMESPTRDTHTILVSLCSPLLSCALSPFLAVPSFPKLPITVLPYPYVCCFPSCFSSIFSSSFIFPVLTHYEIKPVSCPLNRWWFILRGKKKNISKHIFCVKVTLLSSLFTCLHNFKQINIAH